MSEPMTFDARTAEPGSRCEACSGNGYVTFSGGQDLCSRCDGRGTVWLHAPEPGSVQWNLQRALEGVERAIRFIKDGHCGASHALDLVFCGLRDSAGHLRHVIAPEPEAKSAVPEPAQGEEGRFDRPLDREGDPILMGPWYWARSRTGKVVGTGKFASNIGSGQVTFFINGAGYCPDDFTYWKAESDLASRDETIKRLEGENKEYLQKIFLMYHAAGICDGSDEIESVKRLKADRDTLQSDNAHLTADLSEARERVTVLEGERDEAVDVIDGLLSFSGQPLCRWQHEWDDEVLKAQVILERQNKRKAALSGSVEDA